MNAACSSRYSDGEQVYECARGTGHEGPHQHYPYTWVSELSVDYDPSKSRLQSADSALDRASIPEMFNLLAGEIRKLGGQIEEERAIVGTNAARLNKLIADNERIESQLSTFKDGTYERINLLATDNEKMQSQLTALRAEADKKREQIVQKLELLDYITEAARNGGTASRKYDEYRTLIVATLSRMEERIVEIGAMQRARKKKQERKRRGARKNR